MLARDLAPMIGDGTSAKLRTQPGDAAALAEHADWVHQIAKAAVETANSLDTETLTNQGKRDEALKAAERVLAVAGELVEENLLNAKALSDQLDGWRARGLMAQETKDRASAQVPIAATLDQTIAALRRRRESLEEVARLLGDGHFVKWLVERRQQLLLAVASDILAGMTGDRYRFAADFTVIDGRTGVARKPNTLSGGESFMASLSLALGMAEIAARSGGRIGSLYLDEGFGALDPNALDEAINALEARARSGQMILIVSHVPAIAQRIERVLKVIPDPEGSRAEWLDDADREALLVEAATAEI
jgi:exonuclease SbcC